MSASLPSPALSVTADIAICELSEKSKSYCTQMNPLNEQADEMSLIKLECSPLEAKSADHELRTAPLIMRDAYRAPVYEDMRSQYGVLGGAISFHSKTNAEVPDDCRIYINIVCRSLYYVCGVQGSGKSHTISVLLESMLVPKCTRIGRLDKPLAGLVLHFGEGGASAQPCEAAWIGASQDLSLQLPSVKVFVAQSSLKTMTKVYSALGPSVEVEPLLFTEHELDAEAFLAMMSVGSSDGAPLYIQRVLLILRELGEEFTYSAFEKKLEEAKADFNPAQLSGINQRMALLNSFMVKQPKKNGKSTFKCPASPRFKKGQLTIVDLSDPFIDANSACGFFEIITRLFVRADTETGKVLLLDEAHQYLSPGRASSGFTKSILGLVRKQRHLGMRILISTQEPTVIPPMLLDLCPVTIMHRFSSPSWWNHVYNHVAADVDEADIVDRIVRLATGQAIVIAPSASVALRDFNGTLSVQQLGRKYMIMKTRERVTKDGGASILETERGTISRDQTHNMLEDLIF